MEARRWRDSTGSCFSERPESGVHNSARNRHAPIPCHGGILPPAFAPCAFILRTIRPPPLCTSRPFFRAGCDVADKWHECLADVCQTARAVSGWTVSLWCGHLGCGAGISPKVSRRGDLAALCGQVATATHLRRLGRTTTKLSYRKRWQPPLAGGRIRRVAESRTVI